jgi:cyclophilin family peptidyl-prolyl cis-trans isomerase
MKRTLLVFMGVLLAVISIAQKDSTLKKKDRKRDVLLQTSMGDITIRLSDSTPLHRDNFLKMVKVGYYDSVLFHRVIKNFMIQGGDPASKNAAAGKPLGVIAAARDNNPAKESSASQFYIVQGKIFTEAGLDSVETLRLNRKLPAYQREVYKTIGGVPHLDQNYTVYGEVVKGLDVVDKIAAVETSKNITDRDRPLADVRIIKAKLVKRKRKR